MTCQECQTLSVQIINIFSQAYVALRAQPFFFLFFLLDLSEPLHVDEARYLPDYVAVLF